jgi:hypothetical protein
MKIDHIAKKPLQEQDGVAGKVAGMASGADNQAAQKTAQGAKMATSAMGAKGGSGAQMAKGLDKLASGGALQGNLAKQIAPFAKQLTTILGDQAMRQKFMMLVKQAQKGADMAVGAVANATGASKDDVNAAAQQQDLKAKIAKPYLDTTTGLYYTKDENGKPTKNLHTTPEMKQLVKKLGNDQEMKAMIIQYLEGGAA